MFLFLLSWQRFNLTSSVEVETMEKIEIRAVIKFFFIKGLKGREIYGELESTLGTDAVSYATVKNWVAEFKRGRSSTEDEARSGRPADGKSEENIDAVQDMILADRRNTISKIAETLRLSEATTFRIVTEELGYKKVCARWVPRMLTHENKRNRTNISRRNLELYNENPENFCDRYVTMDETWAHHYNPESKQQSMQWKHVGSPRVVKFREVTAVGKVLASVFWDCEGILFVDYLDQGRTITGTYYAELLRKLRNVIKEKRRGKLSRKVLFHHDNAPAHTSQVAMAALHENGFELLEHPAYSPDLAPSDYHLFKHLKNFIRGTRFSSNDEVSVAVNQWFRDQPKDFYLAGVRSLKNRWEKCINLRGDYIEKL